MDVDVHHPVGGPVVLVEEAADLHDPRVVDQHVHRPEVAFHLVEEALEGTPVGDVQLGGDGPRAELGGGLLRSLQVHVAQRHLHALAHQSLRRCPADPACSPCDGSDLSVQRAGLLGH